MMRLSGCRVFHCLLECLPHPAYNLLRRRRGRHLATHRSVLSPEQLNNRNRFALVIFKTAPDYFRGVIRALDQLAAAFVTPSFSLRRRGANVIERAAGLAQSPPTESL